MIKKGFIVLGVFRLIHCVIIACCPDPTTYYNSITSVQITNCALQSDLVDNSIVSQGDYRIRITINKETFAQGYKTSFLFVPTYATSCEDNYDGLKSDIVEFKITCNHDILETKAGEAIAFEKINVYSIGFNNDAQNLRRTIPQWLNIMNNSLRFVWYIEFNEPIKTNESLRFQVSIRQEDGTHFNVETESVNIK